MKKLTKMMLLLSAVMITFTACSKDDESSSGSDGKAKIENLAISPSSGLTYGDVVTLTGILSDETGLRSYTTQVSNASGVIYESTQMLTGKTFNLNQDVVIPLAPNAIPGDLTLSLTVKNSGDQLTSTELKIKNVQLPNFPQLYLYLNGTIYEMVKNGNVFEFEDFVPAGATGKIYAKSDRTGIFWGWEDGAVKVMGANDITFGKADEEFFKISFNVVSFALTLGEAQTWSPMSTDPLYILGTISGHWEDNDNKPDGITVEMAKMKMTGYSLGKKKMWTWEPPNTGSGNKDDDMWGNTVAGVFRLKKGGVEQYITYAAGKIVTGTDNKANSFILPAAGSFHIRVMADVTGITSVRTFDEGLGKSLEYKNNEVMLNGVLAPANITFAGGTMNLLPGNYFIYEGTLELTNGQSVTGNGIDLAALYSDGDIFTGGGNKTWKYTGLTGQYYFRIDAFSGHVYAKDVSGYPSAIYMDGWCWKKYTGDPRSNWNTGTELTLHRKGSTNVYEATCYVQPWNGDIKFFAQPSTADNLTPQGVISAAYFSGAHAMTDGIGILLPVPSDPGAYYKVTVDLKDGMTTNEAGDYIPVGAKFTYSFTAL